MAKRDAFNLTELDDSLDLNISFDPTYNIDKLDSEDDDNQLNLLEMAVSNFLKHNNTIACLEDVLKLMNAARNTKSDLPCTKFTIFKTLSERSTHTLDRKFYLHCSDCRTYSGGFSAKQGQKCKQCEKSLTANETNFFIYMPIGAQLIQSIKMNWSLIERYCSDLSELWNLN